MNQLENNKKVKAKVGDWAYIKTEIGWLYGLVVMSADIYENEKIQKGYTIIVNKSQYVSIIEDDIEIIEVYSDKVEKEITNILENKYGIECYDESGKLKNNMTLVNELISDNKWSMIEDNDKRLFIRVFSDTDEKIIDGWNGCYHRMNELHQKNKKLTEENDTLREMLMNIKKKKSNTVADEMATALALIGIGGALCAMADNM